ncbi:protein YceG like [Streptococcus sp. DD10]|nr:protein YceG like [Streptococcus sp. DD10]
MLVLGVTGFVGYNYINSALRPIDAKSTEYVTVEIPAGSGSKAIGAALEEAGLIRNATVFNLYTQVKNYSGFQSGYYNLQKSMSVDELAKALQKGGTETPQLPVLAKLTIPEGYTLEQIAATTAEATKNLAQKISSDDFMNKVQDETFINQMVAKYPQLLASLPTLESGVRYRLEGYLFPATYNITSETTVETLIDEMLGAMDTNLVGYYDQINAQNRTVNEVLSLASLVEKEGATDEDRKNIASVFFNRIAQGMPLQSNIAILYAQGKLGEATTLQEDAQIDTNIDSAFNIYRNAGLMPGPVDSPSLSAISAVISPNSTDYLYFVADVKTGKVYFANNYADHEQNVTTYVNNQIAASN